MTPIDWILITLLITTNYVWINVFLGYKRGVEKAIRQHMEKEHN